MTLRNIHLELARCPEFPEGSNEFGYDIKAPLTEDGHISIEDWSANADQCTVRRFWRHEDDENGMLVHTDRGWKFDYDPDQEDDDEPLFRLDDHIFKEGEYVSVTEHDGVQRTFQVKEIR